jgi:hypothetical protein
MGSSAKRRQTFSKVSRERELKERREAKRQKKADRKAAAAEGAEPVDQASTDVIPSDDGSK